MNDDQLDDLVRATARVSDADVARWDLTSPEREMREAIMSRHPLSTAADDAGDRAAHGDDGRRPEYEISPMPATPRRRRRFAAVATASAAALVAVAVWVAAQPGEHPVAVAPPAGERAAPQLIVDLPGWEIDHVSDAGYGSGSFRMSDGVSALEFHWHDQVAYEHTALERQELGRAETLSVLGRPADLWVRRQADPSATLPDGLVVTDPSMAPDFGDFTALWRDDEGGVEARGYFPSEESFRAALAALVEVDRDRWFAAMGPSVVLPDQHAGAIIGMLADIPVPPAFDPSTLPENAAHPITRYDLGAEVTTEVTCGWVETWAAAIERGDEQVELQAIDAMATSHEWAILIEMDAEGDFPSSIWQIADAMPTDAPFGPSDAFTVAQNHEQLLGCNGTRAGL